MKILIIGAKGMLGQELVSAMSDYNLIAWGRKDIDITDLEQINTKLGDLKPDIVINTAAYTDVDGCETNKDICMQVNGYGPGYLAKFCKEIDAVLVHYSTDYIFNGKKQDGYKEDYSKVEPISVYGESKALGEKLIQENCEKYYILRTAWLYGNNGINFVDTMIKLGSEKDELKVVNDQHGSPTYTLDVANRTKEIIIDMKPDYGIYHVTNSDNCTWYEFAKEIFKNKNIKINLNPCTTSEFPRSAQRPEYSILLNTKLPAMRSWQEALQKYLSLKY